MLCWKQLHGAISPGPLVHAGEVGFRALLSLHREPQDSAVGAALPWLDTHFMVTAVKATRCLQLTQGQWPQLSAWSWLLLQRGRIWGVRSGWWVDRVLSCRAYCPLLLPPVSAEWHLYQLLPEGVTLATCHRLQHEWSFFILHFSPCCLLSTPQVPFFFLFWKDTALKFKCRKKWLHFLFRSVSQKASKSSLAETQGLFRMGNIISHSFACSRCGFHPPLLSHTRADGDSGVDYCCLPWLPLWEGWGPFPKGDQSSYSMSPK